jgi:Fe2+ transport system protein B
LLSFFCPLALSIDSLMQLILLQSRAVAQYVRERACDLPASVAARQLSMTKRDLLFYWQVALMHCAPPLGRVVPD